MKNVLLVVIDALSARVVPSAIESGQLPTFQQLKRRGVLRDQCTSVFPSITPAATASIVTGRDPADHGISGNFWFDRDHDSVAYYGDDFPVIFNAGFGKFFSDYLLRLNFQRLQSETLYESVERCGMSAAALNYMWFRGDVDHDVNVPLLLKLLPGVNPVERVRGPRVLGLADFARSNRPGSDQPLQATGGMSRRFGFHDDTTAEYLLDLAEADPFPEFTLAYFPNNDFESHKVGPHAALPVVQSVDRYLGQFIERRGGLDKFLDEFVIVIVGDHAQSDLCENEDERSIDLTNVLSDYQLANPGETWSDGDRLMVCPNMRASQIYIRHRDQSSLSGLIERLLGEQRIDQVLWRDADNGPSYHVATRNRGVLHFTESRSSSDPVDDHDNHWSFDGQLSAIDATFDESNRIRYQDYPNALERIVGGFSDVSGDIWVTAALGHEFRVPHTHISESGSHGSLHVDDSQSCLLVAGIDEVDLVPRHPRITDVAPLCLSLLGIEQAAAS